MSMLLRRARRSLSAVLVGTFATMPVAAAAHAAPERPVTSGDVSVTLIGDKPATATFTVRNNSAAPVQGFGIRLRALPVPVTVDGDFVNCYGTRDDRPHALPVTCLFPVTLAAGTEYRVDLPVRGADAAWPGQSVYEEYDVDSWSDAATASWRQLAKRTGPTLGVQPAAEPMPAAAFEDRGQSTSYGQHFFRVRQEAGKRPDLAAVAENVTARPGETVRPGAGVRNAGAVALRPNAEIVEDGQSRAKKPVFKITVPDGVTVVDVAEDCHRYPDGSEPTSDPFANKKEFLCYGVPWRTSPFKPGERYVPAFGLRLDREVRDAVGTVTVVLDGDDNPANNTAQYVINPTSPTSTSPATPGAAPATTVADSAGGGAGDGGGLPVTGPSLIGFLTGGIAVLLTGVALLVATRRRAPRAKA
ncbi:hypothetical protein [Krasilnikovia sp. M28-CT-15]|uniref:hypothetical protein n=1 Tax=Krasilnikovia sp. M28-CT-15 TaxID=3373540 RepID=UPI003876A1ED